MRNTLKISNNISDEKLLEGEFNENGIKVGGKFKEFKEYKNDFLYAEIEVDETNTIKDPSLSGNDLTDWLRSMPFTNIVYRKNGKEHILYDYNENSQYEHNLLKTLSGNYADREIDGVFPFNEIKLVSKKIIYEEGAPTLDPYFEADGLFNQYAYCVASNNINGQRISDIDSSYVFNQQASTDCMSSNKIDTNIKTFVRIPLMYFRISFFYDPKRSKYYRRYEIIPPEEFEKMEPEYRDGFFIPKAFEYEDFSGTNYKKYLYISNAPESFGLQSSPFGSDCGFLQVEKEFNNFGTFDEYFATGLLADNSNFHVMTSDVYFGVMIYLFRIYTGYFNMGHLVDCVHRPDIIFATYFKCLQEQDYENFVNNISLNRADAEPYVDKTGFFISFDKQSKGFNYLTTPPTENYPSIPTKGNIYGYESLQLKFYAVYNDAALISAIQSGDKRICLQNVIAFYNASSYGIKLEDCIFIEKDTLGKTFKMNYLYPNEDSTLPPQYGSFVRVNASVVDLNIVVTLTYDCQGVPLELDVNNIQQIHFRYDKYVDMDKTDPKRDDYINRLLKGYCLNLKFHPTDFSVEHPTGQEYLPFILEIDASPEGEDVSDPTTFEIYPYKNHFAIGNHIWADYDCAYDRNEISSDYYNDHQYLLDVSKQNLLNATKGRDGLPKLFDYITVNTSALCDLPNQILPNDYRFIDMKTKNGQNGSNFTLLYFSNLFGQTQWYRGGDVFKYKYYKNQKIKLQSGSPHLREMTDAYANQLGSFNGYIDVYKDSIPFSLVFRDQQYVFVNSRLQYAYSKSGTTDSYLQYRCFDRKNKGIFLKDFQISLTGRDSSATNFYDINIGVSKDSESILNIYQQNTASDGYRRINYSGIYKDGSGFLSYITYVDNVSVSNKKYLSDISEEGYYDREQYYLNVPIFRYNNLSQTVNIEDVNIYNIYTYMNNNNYNNNNNLLNYNYITLSTDLLYCNTLPVTYYQNMNFNGLYVDVGITSNSTTKTAPYVMNLENLNQISPLNNTDFCSLNLRITPITNSLIISDFLNKTSNDIYPETSDSLYVKGPLYDAFSLTAETLLANGYSYSNTWDTERLLGDYYIGEPTGGNEEMYYKNQTVQEFFTMDKIVNDHPGNSFYMSHSLTLSSTDEDYDSVDNSLNVIDYNYNNELFRLTRQVRKAKGTLSISSWEKSALEVSSAYADSANHWLYSSSLGISYNANARTSGGYVYSLGFKNQSYQVNGYSFVSSTDNGFWHFTRDWNEQTNLPYGGSIAGYFLIVLKQTYAVSHYNVPFTSDGQNGWSYHSQIPNQAWHDEEQDPDNAVPNVTSIYYNSSNSQDYQYYDEWSGLYGSTPEDCTNTFGNELSETAQDYLYIFMPEMKFMSFVKVEGGSSYYHRFKVVGDGKFYNLLPYNSLTYNSNENKYYRDYYTDETMSSNSSMTPYSFFTKYGDKQSVSDTLRYALSELTGLSNGQVEYFENYNNDGFRVGYSYSVNVGKKASFYSQDDVLNYIKSVRMFESNILLYVSEN